MSVSSRKVALVTGGNRGIGLAIVKGLAKLGFNVLMGCRDVKAGAVEIAKIQREQPEADVSVVQLDLADAETLPQQMQHITEQHPAVDVLINNAAILDEGDFSSLSRDDFYRSMQTNALSVFDLMQHFGLTMEQQQYGRIVNISSGWGAFSDGLTGPAAYSMSKATLNAITKVAANGYAGYSNIKINAMCPGWVRTRMGGMAASRSPEQAAETAIWLATLSQDGPSGEFFRDKKAINW